MYTKVEDQEMQLDAVVTYQRRYGETWVWFTNGYFTTLKMSVEEFEKILNEGLTNNQK